jgi:uncharacterized membrane protein HdeD (DUF308 family)
MAVSGTAREAVRKVVGGALLDHLAKNWWLMLLRGIIAVLFGAVAIFWPGATLLSLVFLWGAYAIADGAFSLWAAITGRVSEMTPRWWLAVVGIVGIAAGIMAWVWPGATALALLVLIAAWAMLTGAMQIWGAIRLRKEIEGEWLLGLSGSLSLLLGAVLLLQPAAGAVAVVWWIGGFAILMGIAQIALALKLRGHVRLED